MSLNNGPANFLGKALTPECGNLTRSIKWSSMIVIIVLLVAFILLIGAIIYNYVKKIPSDTNQKDNENKKKKIVGGMTIGSVVVLGIGLISSIWQYTAVSKTSKLCLPA